MSFKPYIVGISGGSASGKTSFLRKLREGMPEDTVCIVSQDNYYLPMAQQQRDDNDQINFDLPSSIQRQQFFEDMQRLKSGQVVQINEYTYNNAARQVDKLVLEPAPIIIMEGLFIFHYEEIREELDLKVYIDARDEVKLERRLKRDILERGYSEEAILYQWHNHVLPCYSQFLRPYRDDADIIVTNNKSFDKGLSVLLDHLKEVLKSDTWSANKNSLLEHFE
ncbi:MAG: uridine kinase [Bacteroidia bacterium]|nr:uridine kinase [Bacteroidia bacterium]